MYQRFRDYLYYLLPAPFKKVRQEINQWYIFLQVIGDEYDKMQKELYQALDQTSVATCSEMMLQYYAQDRGMYRYPEESTDNFRSRIAMYDELEALGGTKEAILLAAKTLGYEEAEHIWYPDMGYKDKWSQFLLRLKLKDGKEHPVNFDVLKKEIRRVKESTSLDNYCFCNELDGRIYAGSAISIKNYVEVGDIEL